METEQIFHKIHNQIVGLGSKNFGVTDDDISKIKDSDNRVKGQFKHTDLSNHQALLLCALHWDMSQNTSVRRTFLKTNFNYEKQDYIELYKRELSLPSSDTKFIKYIKKFT